MRRGIQSRALWKKAPSSDSVADAMIFYMMELMMCIALLYGGGMVVELGAVDGS
jgi:hypothetical protein